MSRAVKRRAPKTGYTFIEKEHYRNRVWMALVRCCPVPVKVAHALLMPSIEGTEIDVALRAGFREENLHIVDRNPAIVATLKRRYPAIKTYGVEIERAAARIAANGFRIHVANFDFTSCMGDSFFDTLQTIRDTEVLASGAAWAVTLLRGRETVGAVDELIDGLLVPFIDEWKLKRGETWSVDCELFRTVVNARRVGPLALNDRDVVRVGFGSVLHRRSDTTVDKVGIYRSGSQTMLWAIYRPVRLGNGPKAKFKNLKETLTSYACTMGLVAFERPTEDALFGGLTTPPSTQGATPAAPVTTAGLP